MLNRTFQSFTEYRTGVLIWKTIPPVLIIFGTIGNVLSIVVLTRKSTITLFLICLTFSDLIVLYTGLLRQWLIYLFSLDVRNINKILCKVHTWLVYSSLDFSSWILIAVTLERVIAVWCPHSAKTKCNRFSATCLVITILMFVLGLNTHLLYGMTIKISNNQMESKCVSVDENYSVFFRSAWTWIDLCVFSLIPFAVILIGNSLILIKLFQRRSKAKTNSREREKNASNKNVNKNNRGRHRKNKYHHQSSMTSTLFTLNTVFLLTTLPISVYDIGYSYWHSTKSHYLVAVLELWWAVVNMLMYTNNALNFLLYSLSGSRFRKEFKRIMCRRQRSTKIKFHVLLPKMQDDVQKGEVAQQILND